MTRVSVKGFQIFVDRHGKPRCYHRATRTAIDLIAAPLGSAEFFAECARIATLAKAVRSSKPGTLGMLIAEYRRDSAFTDLAQRTRRDYQRIFDYLKAIDDTPLIRFDRALVIRIRDKATARGRRFANYVKAVLSVIFGWGIERAYLSLNPAGNLRNIRRPKDAPQANRPWRDEERYAVLAEVPPHMKPAVALMMFAGLGPKDALKLPRTHFRSGEIATRRSKTGAVVFWPAPAELRAILAAAPIHNAITLCANSNGKSWTESGFRASWRHVRIRLEKSGVINPGLTLYGLRHTVAVILRESGFDERTIWPAPGSEDTELGVLMELEVGHGATEVYAGVQA